MASAAWDRKRTAHLYRRAGFGGTPEELELAVALGREGAISRLVDYDAISTADLDAYLDLLGLNDLDGYTEVPYDRFSQLVKWWCLRMNYSPRPLEEKMTLFWHNHFATSVQKIENPQKMYVQNQIFRSLGMGRFGDLLLAVSRDPAMLLWLDNASNVQDAPNENFAREVMELFTMGVGHYTQEDVTEAARAFTGWTVEGRNNELFTFNADYHDPEVKYVLGNLGRFKGEDVIAILAARPETAAYMTAKLARFFIGTDPSSELAGRLQGVYAATAGDIRSIVREILLSNEFDATADAPDMIKSPIEFVVGINRALGLFPDYSGDPGWADAMGMGLFRPPNVAGWKGGQSWIHTGSYLYRMNFAWNHATFPSPWGDVYRFDISRFFEGRNFANPDELIDFLADRFSLVGVPDSLRRGLRQYLDPPEVPFTWTTAAIDWLGRGAIYLVMASPEYQLQ